MRRRASALTIAGSDPSGGAGLELDLQVFAVHGVPAGAVATCLTRQDSRGVGSVRALPVAEGMRRLETVLDDQRIPAAKIGMLPSPSWVRALAGSRLCAARRILVLDPVLAPTRGAANLDERGVAALRRWLLPRITLVTPNLPELARLVCRSEAAVRRDPEAAIRALLETGVGNVLLKGGHGRGATVVDRLRGAWGDADLTGPRRRGVEVRGTGCALSAALVARLVREAAPLAAVRAAVAFTRAAIRRAAPRGRGRPELHLGGA